MALLPRTDTLATDLQGSDHPRMSASLTAVGEKILSEKTVPCFCFTVEVCAGMGMVGMGIDVVGIPRGWKWELRGSLGDGICFAGTPRGRFRNLADINNNSGASVRILGKLCCKISYVAVKCVVDGWSNVFWYCCKKTTFRR